MYRLLVICCLAVLLAACSSKTADNTNAQQNANNAGKPLTLTPQSEPKTKSNESKAPVKQDYTSPKTAVETFLSAAQNRDLDALSQCFDPQSAEEFQDLRNKTATQNNLDKLAHQFEGAQAGEVKAKGDAAVVTVKLKDGSEEINLKKSAGGWKIVDF